MTRNLILLAMLGLMSVVGFVVYGKFNETQALKIELEERERVISRLVRTQRVAQAMVTGRFVGEDGVVRTEVQFVEIDENGEPLQRKQALVRGEQVYFDALVLKFDSELVKEGDPVRGKSILLFRRMFGEDQTPNEGAPLDDDGIDAIPTAYRSGSTSEVERELWQRFWEYASDPALRARDGVRVAQGEAPSIRMEKGVLYELTLDANGGLNIASSRVPAIFMKEDG